LPTGTGLAGGGTYGIHLTSNLINTIKVERFINIIAIATKETNTADDIADILS
jgi:hypothetical protein|tara:strand:+ start:345 stop:503 length:159 start_codon:yes stop_codon:yes gene_type:complete